MGDVEVFVEGSTVRAETFRYGKIRLFRARAVVVASPFAQIHIQLRRHGHT